MFDKLEEQYSHCRIHDTVDMLCQARTYIASPFVKVLYVSTRTGELALKDYLGIERSACNCNPDEVQQMIDR